MAMGGALANASATLTLDVNNFVTNAQRASDAAQGIQRSTDSVQSGGFLSWIQQNEAALSRWGKGLMAVGGLITAAFTVPVVAGTRAAWGYADSMQQSRVALNAYVEDGREVDQLMADIVAYSQSDRSGGLFFVDELAAAATNMILYGAEADRAAEYTEILSRSVGLGTGNWNDLNRVIGRIGSTGRITRDDFEMLTKMGYELDESIIGQTVSWDELFVLLDDGIPADALVGQAGTIRAAMAWLQGAVLNLGAEFLGLDLATGEFLEGGLGWQMMRGLERVTDLMNAAAPAVGRFGSMIASVGRPLGTLFDWFLRLPQPILTAIATFTAITGVALTLGGALLMISPQIAGAIIAFQRLGGVASILGGVTKAVGALRVAMVGLFMNPALMAGMAAIAVMVLAYQTNFLGFADAVGWGLDKLKEFGEYLFGVPEQKTVNFDIETLADVGFHDWQEMPDGSYKHADLGLTASGSGLGVVTWVADPSSPDGKAWTLTVTTTDADGNSVDQAMKIIDSEALPDGTFKMTVEAVDGTVYETWYDENSNQTIFIEIDAETESAEASIGRVQQHLQGITEWLGRAKDELNAILNADWGNLDWDSFLGLSKIIDGLVNDWWMFVDAVYWGEEKIIAGWDAMTSAIGSAWSSTTQKIGDSWESAGNGIIRGWEWMQGAWDSVTGFIESVWSAVTSEVSKIWDAFVNGGFMSGINAIGDTISSVVEGVQSFVGDVVGAIESVVQSAIDGINKLISLANNIPGVNIGDVGDEGGERGDGVTATPRQGSGVNPDPSIAPPAARSEGRIAGLVASIAAIQKLTDPAVNALSALDNKMNDLDASALRSSDSLNTTASTMPMYTSATRDADSATGAMASGMGASFGNIASSALSNFSTMQSEASGKTASMNALASSNAASMQTSVTGSLVGMRANAATQLGLLAGTTGTQTSNMQSTASSNASSMASQVGGHILGMRTAAALQMGLMASSGESSGSRMNTGLTGWMAGAHARIVASMASMVQAVRNAGSSGYSAGHYAGSQIGAGMAAGMSAYLGQIRASANEMVAAASRAVIARAMISSPSRLFQQYGEYIGEGLEIGILRSIPDIGRAADRMLNASVPSPALNAPISGGYGGGTTVVHHHHVHNHNNYVTPPEMVKLIDGSSKGREAYNHLSDPDAHNYGGGA